MSIKNKNIYAILAVLLSAAIVGFSFPVVKTALLYTSPVSILMDRILIAAVAIILLKKLNIIKLEKVSSKQKIALFFLSTLYPIIFFLLQNIGINKITVSETSIIFAMSPILTTVATALILKESTTVFQKIGIVFSFLGMVYISLNTFSGISGSKAGYIIMFGSVTALVLYLVLMRKYVAKLSSFTITYYLISYAAIIAIILFLTYGLSSSEKVFNLSRFNSLKYIFLILYLGVLSTFITSLLTAYGIKKLSTVQTSIVNNVSPIFGVLAGVIVMNDVLEIFQIVGGLIVFIGMFMSLKYKRTK